MFLSPHSSKLFSLIELLVVASVIVVLMTILLPSLNKTMERGIQVHCKNNIKSINLAVGVYQHDYENYYPNGIPLKPGSFGYWDFTIGKSAQELLLDYLTDPETNFICPSDPSPENYWYWRFRDNPNYTQIAKGSSYMFSEHGILGIILWTGEALNNNNIRKPSTFGYMTDGRAYPNGWGWHNADINRTRSRIDWGHLDMVNFLFGDGHVESVFQIDAASTRSDPR